MEKQITLKSEIIGLLISATLDEKSLEGWEGWTLESNTDKGIYDSEKGAMTDYHLTLTSPDGKIYKGRGGYYTGATGECYHYDIDFTLKPDRKKRTAKDEDEYQLYLKLKEKYEGDISNTL